jgi:hypothetical protein
MKSKQEAYRLLADSLTYADENVSQDPVVERTKSFEWRNYALTAAAILLTVSNILLAIYTFHKSGGLSESLKPYCLTCSLIDIDRC